LQGRFARGYEGSTGDGRCGLATGDRLGDVRVEGVAFLLGTFDVTTSDGRWVGKVAVLLGFTGSEAAAAPMAHALTVRSGTVTAAITFIALLIAENG